MRRLAVLAVALAGLSATGAALLGRGDGRPFPHGKHAGLFPSCVGCHEGIARGDTTRWLTVGPEECANCHDGSTQPRVSWTPPSRPATNTRFSHAEHARAQEREGAPPLDCTRCHAAASPASRMDVGRARPASCVSCHAHRSPTHLASESRCSTCHLPLAQASELSAERIAGFPKPPDHEAADFLHAHGEAAAASGASCAVCHARESCARCHLNADRVPAIRALAPDPRVASLVAGRKGEWPEPDSHRDPDWTFRHASAARSSLESCANCHAASSCASCHRGASADFLARLPVARPGGPTGVSVAATRPPGHGPGFETSHGPAASANLPSCQSCHAESFCASCHRSSNSPTAAPRPPAGAGDGAAGADPAPARSASRAGGFHPPDYVTRHAADAFAERVECSQCHSKQAFCLQCHQRMGVGPTSRAGTMAFHDAQPNWLLAHGRAARQNMESCTSCHAQTSCLRCHSAKSGLRINPHGPGFDPSRIADRSQESCAVCHYSLPQ